jgi:ribA/ribD-fused uncharacterized protein
MYSSQTGVTLTQEQQVFSFLNRSFVFRRSSKKSEPEPAEETVEEKKEENENKEEPKKRKLKLQKEEEEPVLFHGADESKGEYRNFSNMSLHPIQIDDEKFPSVEHYFQAMKAKEFKDEEVYEKIIQAKSAKAAKALGKKVKGFEKEVWDAKKDGYMQTGIKAKFVQHPELRKQLLETDKKIIGDANARNTYWGIGTSVSSEKAKHPSKWRGQNRIGKILMDLRTEFQGES